MSAPGPESVPTSADPRSHRPTKKRALTPVSAQAASVEALFAKPDQVIRIPESSSSAGTVSRAAPPEIVTNVQGSSAGAGSGEFHVYKASRRREYERLREMDEALRREKDSEEFDKDKSDRDRKDEERTRKNREKREKMKARKAKKGKGPSNATGAGADKKQPAGPSNGVSRPEKDGQDDAADSTTKPQDGEEKPTSTPSAEPAGLVIHDDD
ncbi:PRKR-interacting 1 [Fusarium albosuccineum]|uniref:PRKR-interacting 1 n=1 Tax=Fusarium albosuccineum TaxID=1237068 RepID=A0A8H4PF44_9HYPO|nr:PRKR-interacting 1 [Fusarium albosuccineum]